MTSCLRPGTWRTTATVGLLLAVHLLLAVGGVLGRSVTSDETAHLTAGYVYWKYGDYRFQPENGNLPQRWGALPLLLARPHLEPTEDPIEWQISSVWNVAQRFLFERGNNTDYLLLWARCFMLAWSVAAGLLVYFWAKSIWGGPSGVAALALFAISPTTLAHGPLVTSDMCASVALLAACGAGWRMCLQPSVQRVLLFGLVAGLAFVAKFSAVLLLPVFAALGLVAFLIQRRAGALEPRARPLRYGFAVAAAATIAWAVVWAFYGFRYSATTLATAPFDHFYVPWSTIKEKPHLWTPLIGWCERVRLLPEPYLYGFSFVAFFSEQRGAFLAGAYSSYGWWWFFPFAFAVKSTVGELLIATLLIIRSTPWLAKLQKVDGARILRSPLLPLSLFTMVYGAFSITTHLNIGQRHILPLYLVLFIVAGGLFAATCSRWFRILGVGAIALGGFESIANSPHHLAFFNQLVGGPRNGWHLLVDSSLDWGQDVAPLGDWVQRNRVDHELVYVSCFGTADPRYEGIEGLMLAPYYPLGRPREWYELKPGLYCISATMLQDVYGLNPGPWSQTMERDFQNLKIAAKVYIADGTWTKKIPEVGFHPEHPLWLLDRLRFARLCQYLKVRKPDAVINYTQFVYRLSTAEIETFSNQPYSALAALMESATRSEQLP